jgi:16S rRNA (uracil1498-N3)-methyltransferase
MRVFVLPQNPPAGQFLNITGKDYHYLARVRRVKVGEQIPGTDGRGRSWRCTVLEIGPSSLRLRLEKTPDPPLSPQLSICLIQCLPKAKKMDLIVRQATEAGIWRLIPVFSRYCQVRYSDKQETERKLERWQRIAREALQQSGAAAAPIIVPPRELEAVLADLSDPEDGEVRLFFHQDREGSDTLHGCLSKIVKIITLVVGPEGGLDENEINLLRSKSFVPITLGRTVLRAETAALYALAAVQTVIHERKVWEPT